MNTPAFYRILTFILIPLAFSCSKTDKTFQSFQQNPGTQNNLRAVYFVSEDTGYAGGGLRYWKGNITRTTDGGKSWKADSVLNKIVFDLHFLNAKRGFAACLDGKILGTVDGGLSWSLYQDLYWVHLHDIHFVNDTLGFIVGGFGYGEGVILKTDNGGSSWQSKLYETEFRCVTFLNEKTGFAGGYGMLLKTEDGGESWDTTRVVGDFFRDIFFPSPDIGFLIGSGGSVFKTEDGGITWERTRNGNSVINKKYYFNAAFFKNNLEGYIVGRNGIVLKTTDGGDQWVRIEEFTSIDLQDIIMVNSNTGYIVGENGTLYKFVD